MPLHQLTHPLVSQLAHTDRLCPAGKAGLTSHDYCTRKKRSSIICEWGGSGHQHRDPDEQRVQSKVSCPTQFHCGVNEPTTLTLTRMAGPVMVPVSRDGCLAVRASIPAHSPGATHSFPPPLKYLERHAAAPCLRVLPSQLLRKKKGEKYPIL